MDLTEKFQKFIDENFGTDVLKAQLILFVENKDDSTHKIDITINNKDIVDIKESNDKLIIYKHNTRSKKFTDKYLK
jgi:hypothetical protein